MWNWISRPISALMVALAIASTEQTVHAGIPVIDVTNLAQAIQQVTSWIEQLKQMKEQLDQARRTYSAISNARDLGAILNNPMLHNYIPAEAKHVMASLPTRGHGGLTSAAKTLREASMIYNCAEVEGSDARKRCQADLAQPYQFRAYYDEALERAGGRTEQIQQLMEAAGKTADAKEIAEVQARISAENALLQHEMSQIALMRAVAESDARIAESRAREAQRENATRTGRF